MSRGGPFVAAALIVGLTLGACGSVLAIDAASAETSRIGRMDNFNPGAGLDTSQVVWGPRP